MNTWYTTQAGAGVADGTSLADAWALANVDWTGSGVQPGDTLVYSGTFTAAVVVGGSGTAASPIILQGSAAIVEGADTLVECFTCTSKNYITVQGSWLLREPTTSGMAVNGTSTGIIVNDVISEDSGNQAFQNENTASATYNNIIGRGCVDDGFSSHNETTIIVNGGEFYNNDTGVHWIGTPVLLELNNCNIHDNLEATGFGLQCEGGANNWMNGGTLSGNFRVGGIGIKMHFVGVTMTLTGVGLTETSGYSVFRGCEITGDGSNHVLDNYGTGTEIEGCLIHSNAPAKWAVLIRTAQDLVMSNTVINGENATSQGLYKNAAGTDTINNCHFMNLSVGCNGTSAPNVITMDNCNFYNNATDKSGTVTSTNEQAITPDFADVVNGDMAIPSSSSLVGAGTKWWGSSRRPTGLGGEPFSDNEVDLNCEQSNHNPFHPVNL